MKVVQISDPSCWDRELPHVLAGVVAERVKEEVARFCVENGLGGDTVKTLMSKWSKNIAEYRSITPVHGTTEKLRDTSSAVPAYSHPLLSEVVTPLGDVQMCSGNPRDVRFPAGGPIFPADTSKYDLRGNPKSNIKVKYCSSGSDNVVSSVADTEHNSNISSSNSSSSRIRGGVVATGGMHEWEASGGADEIAGAAPEDPPTTDPDPSLDSDVDWGADDAYYEQFARRGYDTFIIAHMGVVERYHSVWRMRMHNAYIRRIWRGDRGASAPELRDTDMVVHSCVVHIDPSDLVNTDAAQGRVRLPAAVTKPKPDGSAGRKRKHVDDEVYAAVEKETCAAPEHPASGASAACSINDNEDDEEEDDDEDILAQYYRSMEEI